MQVLTAEVKDYELEYFRIQPIGWYIQKTARFYPSQNKSAAAAAATLTAGDGV
jgi:hypothetical protein